MAFRPANLNKRIYPGNGNIIGPTCSVTLGITTTQCCQCLCTISGISTALNPQLGCRTQSLTCIQTLCCRCCSCTVCDRTVPSGMWKSSQQYEAATRSAWGDDTCVTGPQIGYQCTSSTPSGNVDCKAFYLGNQLWVAPSCTETATSYTNQEAVPQAITCMSYNTGWFIGSKTTFSNCAYPCRSYWDSYSTGATVYYSSSSSAPGSPKAWWTDMANGTQGYEGQPNTQTQQWCGRAFRKTDDAPQT